MHRVDFALFAFTKLRHYTCFVLGRTQIQVPTGGIGNREAIREFT
jgi:hypothetical protein